MVVRLGNTPSGAQGLLPALSSGITPGGGQVPTCNARGWARISHVQGKCPIHSTLSSPLLIIFFDLGTDDLSKSFPFIPIICEMQSPPSLKAICKHRHPQYLLSLGQVHTGSGIPKCALYVYFWASHCFAPKFKMRSVCSINDYLQSIYYT